MRLNIFIKFFLATTIVIVTPLIVIVGLITFGLANFKIQAILTLLITVLFCLFISILLVRSFIQPFKKIIKGIKEVSRDNLDFIIEIKSKDELGELANYFNEMTRQLKKARISLEEAKETLEVKVAARTRELEKLVATREEIIKQRTKELQDRVDELERIHRLSVGRELKMIELKKEIEKLKVKVKD